VPGLIGAMASVCSVPRVQTPGFGSGSDINADQSCLSRRTSHATGVNLYDRTALTHNGCVTSSSCEALIAEGESAPATGWDFSWLDGRATEERPSWGYAAMLASRLAGTSSVLDIQTGGGEVFAEVLNQVGDRPRYLAATESWSPNAEIARRNLGPLGVSVSTFPTLRHCRSRVRPLHSW
jgi:hypothetical protein